jgi:hypothetical protein
MRHKIVLIGICGFLQVVRADFVPIALTPESYNCDLVVEKTAPGPVIAVTTASMDSGTNNTGFSWYEKGYNLDSKSTGLPKAGVIFNSEARMDHLYQCPPDYRSNNAVLIDADVPAGTFVSIVPAAYVKLSVLTSSGGGDGAIGYKVHHLDGSVETGSLVSPNWLGPNGQALTTYGRVEVQVFGFAGLLEQYPRMYSCDFALTNIYDPVTSIDFTWMGSATHTMIFALSGASTAAADFLPIAVTGYNYDMVVEATASRPTSLTIATTSTMEAGSANIGRTWYEKGYLPTAPDSGLPVGGSILTNSSAPDHCYLLPQTYKGNDAILVDATTAQATLTPAKAAAWPALSVLCAASGGPTTNHLRIEHADGTAELQTLVVPDWLGSAPAAYAVQGRINVDNRFPDLPSGGAPRLFGVDIALANSVSPMTSMDVSFGAGAGPNPHTMILAISGETGTPTTPWLTIACDSAGLLHLIASAPGRLQSTSQLQGTNTAWADEGPISGSMTITGTPDSPVRFFRIRAQ